MCITDLIMLGLSLSAIATITVSAYLIISKTKNSKKEVVKITKIKEVDSSN